MSEAIKLKMLGVQSDILEVLDLDLIENPNKIESLILDYSSPEVLKLISANVDVNSPLTRVIYTSNLFNVKKIDIKVDNIVNLHRINDIRFINKFFEGVNDKLPDGGKFICCVETFQVRKRRKKVREIPIMSFSYFFFEFIFMRAFPKIRFLKTIYFTITRGKNRLLSKAESLGRLISCGFDIIDFQEKNGLLYIISAKKRKPKYDLNPSYGPIYKMPRIGKNGKVINVYKLRTMHPYSEYLQSYMFEKNGTSNGDKINNDFRVSNIGMILRRLWIDELPMIINFLKGDIKLVGVRPLSLSKYEMYPKEAQKARIEVKPGLVPPFYVDLPESFEGLVKSEMEYIEKYKKSPFFTDLNYFFRAMYNIFFKGVRSK